jgi:hypothetical protein
MQIQKLSSGKISGNSKNYITVFIYLIINSLFILKYGEKYNDPLLAVYFAVIAGLYFFYRKVQLKDIFYKSIFWIGVVSFFIFSVFLNYKVDGNSLNVDRWSAMEIGIKAILNGQYPYNIPDHMGWESSNLPMLIVLGMPFYLLFGSVGYLQSFIFLFFSYLIFKIFDNYKLRSVVLLLLFLSPSYLWEVYVKSDLFSNFAIICGFTCLIWKKFLTENRMKLETVSLLTSFLLLTRLSAVIPLTVLLFKKFYGFSLKEKFRFIIIFALSVSLILYIFFHNVPNFDVLMKHNPFTIQGTKQPLLLSFSYIALALVLSFRLKSLYEIIYWSGTLLFICVAVPFVMYFVELGYTEMITNSSFDVSFFNMCMPFILMALVLGIFKNNYKESK